MRVRDVFLRVLGTRPSTSLRAVWGVCVLLLGVPPALTAQDITPAGTRISNVATIRYQAADGTFLSFNSSPVTIVAGQVAGVDLEPPGSAEARPGNKAVFPHVLRNLGNGDDAFFFSTQAPDGWTVALYADVDGDLVLSPSDTLLTGPVPMGSGEEFRFLAVVLIPGTVQPGASASIWLTAVSQFNGSVSDTVQDMLTAIQSPTSVALEKSVDLSRGSAGDILTYTLRYAIGGVGSLSDFRISDQIPLQTEYLPGSIRLGSTGLTDAPDGDPGVFEAAHNRVVFSLGTVSAGEEGSFTFQVQLQDSLAAGSLIQNQGRVDFQTGAGADSTLTEVVETVVVSPELSLEKSVAAPDSVTDGDELTYTIVLRNESPSLPGVFGSPTLCRSSSNFRKPYPRRDLVQWVEPWHGPFRT